jgi:hypothetical protein
MVNRAAPASIITYGDINSRLVFLSPLHRCSMDAPQIDSLYPRHSRSLPPARRYLPMTSRVRPCLAPCDLVTRAYDPVCDIAAPISSSGVASGVVWHNGVVSTLHVVLTLNPSYQMDCSRCVTQTLDESNIRRGLTFTELSIVTLNVISWVTLRSCPLRNGWCNMLKLSTKHDLCDLVVELQFELIKLRIMATCWWGGGWTFPFH